jgi:TatA/E family protein of Tat protein translocase
VDILGIGPLELVLILVIALLVFGPDKLPEIGAKMGKGVRELRQLSREISQGVNTITEPVEELRKPFDDAAQVVGQVSDTAQSLRNPGLALQNAFNQQLTASSTEPTAVVQPSEDNTIAPPRSPESVEPVAALAASASAEPAAIEPAAPAAQPSDVSAPAATPDTLNEVAAAATADPSAIESPAQASER